jgi:hypothetical protein
MMIEDQLDEGHRRRDGDLGPQVARHQMQHVFQLDDDAFDPLPGSRPSRFGAIHAHLPI